MDDALKRVLVVELRRRGLSDQRCNWPLARHAGLEVGREQGP